MERASWQASWTLLSSRGAANGAEHAICSCTLRPVELLPGYFALISNNLLPLSLSLSLNPTSDHPRLQCSRLFERLRTRCQHSPPAHLHLPQGETDEDKSALALAATMRARAGTFLPTINWQSSQWAELDSLVAIMNVWPSSWARR